MTTGPSWPMPCRIARRSRSVISRGERLESSSAPGRSWASVASRSTTPCSSRMTAVRAVSALVVDAVRNRVDSVTRRPVEASATPRARTTRTESPCTTATDMPAAAPAANTASMCRESAAAETGTCAPSGAESSTAPTNAEPSERTIVTSSVQQNHQTVPPADGVGQHVAHLSEPLYDVAERIILGGRSPIPDLGIDLELHHALRRVAAPQLLVRHLGQRGCDFPSLGCRERARGTVPRAISVQRLPAVDEEVER